jgi:glycosyltransferase involved in cell wall biosynthesis
MAEEADLLLFPSLHDEGPMVVAEALTVGLPVVCLDRGGATGFGGTAVRAGRVQETSERLARAMTTARAQPPTSRFSIEAASERFAGLLHDKGLLG